MAKTRVETLDHDYLKARLYYDLLTGEFTWKRHPLMPACWNARYPGKRAGRVVESKPGYKQAYIRIDRRAYSTPRLAWYYVLNRWPEGLVDHINHDSLDHRWVNLREVSFSGNSQNQSKRKDNTSGLMGVFLHKKLNKWQAYIGVNRKTINGGYYDSFEKACARRKELEAEYGFHENHGQ